MAPESSEPSESSHAAADPTLARLDPVRMPRRRWLVGAIAGIAATLGAGAAMFGRDSWRTARLPSGAGELGDAFWRQQFERVDGGVIAIAELSGKPLLLNFWATWCPPCVEELPMIARFFRDQGPNGMQVVGLAIDQPAAVKKFLSRTPVDYPMAMAGAQAMELVRQLGNSGGGLPFTIALRADGSVMGRKMGKLEPADLDAWRREMVHG